MQPAYVCTHVLQASCATMAWLDAWAKLLLEAQYELEQQLSKFTAVIAVQGLVRHSPQRSDYGSPKVPVTPTGGKVRAGLSGHICRRLHIAVAVVTTNQCCQQVLCSAIWQARQGHRQVMP